MKSVKFIIAAIVGLPTVAAQHGSNPWDQYNFSPSTRHPAPVAVHAVVGDASVRTCGNGNHVLTMRAGSRVSLDFGVEVGGLVSFNVASTGDSPLSLAFSESPLFVREISDDTGASPFMDWDQAMNVSLGAGGRDGAVFYRMPEERFRGGFRFVTFNALQDVTVFNVTCEIGFATNMADLRAGTGYFYTPDQGDELLNRVWWAGAYTAQTNMIPANTGRWLPQVRPGWAYNNTLAIAGPVLVDGAKRDRAIWPGDMGICGPVAMQAFGSYGREAVLNALETLFYYQNATTGLLPFAGPATGSFRNGARSNTYHAWALIAMYDYAIYSDDAAWVDRHWANITRGVMNIVDRLDAETGLQVQEFSNDWARGNTGGFNSALNALNYHALVSLATLSPNAAQADGWRAAAARIKSQFNALLWDEDSGLYRDNPESDMHPQDGNSIALWYNLTISAAQRAAISTGLERNWNDIGPVTPELNDTISPFISSIELLAHLHGAQNPSRALKLLRRLWGYMVDGRPDLMTGSTLVEGMASNGSLYYRSEAGYRYDASYTSHAHCWSAGPSIALISGVLGLRVTEMGGRAWELAPQLGDLRTVQAGFETALGWFGAKVEVEGARMRVSLDVPAGTRGTVTVPEEYAVVEVNGEEYTNVHSIQMGW
ncbi:hypothetical protein S40288_01784 [Stachybotrys chartarum IBT 40288]|nr:hypothetical protein S40288_01784 [Stachybotrys chartarum IBT 40288]